MMRSHHIGLYALVEGKKQGNHEELQPHEERRRRSMSETDTAPGDPNEPGLYAIRIKGHLDARWAARFEGLTLTREDNGHTLLTGPVVDQAALHGLLRKVRDLGLPLVAVIQVDPKPANGPDANADTDHNRSTKEPNP
jgi:hypothetical protein